jgi:hypothetical protein
MFGTKRCFSPLNYGRDPHNSTQIAKAQFWDGSSGQGSPILRPNDPVLAIHQASPESGVPGLCGPEDLLDASSFTKYLNFGRKNSGFDITAFIWSIRSRFFHFDHG